MILGIFYLGLGLLAIYFTVIIADTRARYEGQDLGSEFEGNDWVSWMDTEEGVIARSVHPLPGYKPIDRGRVRPGDRLRKLDYEPMIRAEAVDIITSSARPGYLIVANLERTDPISLKKEKLEVFIQNGFRLIFSFNEKIAYWHVIGWLVGIGAFMALVMLAILIPVLRTQRGPALTLLGVVLCALLFFFLQLIRHLYLIIESDLTNIGFEKVFIPGYLVLLFAYAVFYFVFRSELKKWYFFLPSILIGAWILAKVIDIVFLSKDLKYFHSLIEQAAAWYFLLHLGAAVLLYLAVPTRQRPHRIFWGILSVGILSVLGLIYYLFPEQKALFHREHAFFVMNLLLFFPLVNATYLQLQFGKVSLVVTQTIQYLVAIVVSVVIYLLIVQLFDYVNTGIRYRRVLEFITFVLGVIGFRMLYAANASKLRKYFVTSQEQKASRFRHFIARIPQYTNSTLLIKDIEGELKAYFQTENAIFWGSASPDQQGTYSETQKLYQVYESLRPSSANWSKTKEIANTQLEEQLESYLMASGYQLVLPVTVDQDHYALLLLGRKRRGVYNLGDIELLSQLIQQTQLTLNVLQLVKREKELIQQTYEANLTALRSQINPHFLFNTLNSIGELVHESAELAEKAVEKLAFIFRYTLKKSNQNFVPLSEEMKLISTYLDLEKIRFGDRLETHISIAPEVREVSIPAFILQTLVENCIKHGIAKILHKGMVSIEARREGEWLVCEVIDNGPGIDLGRIYKSTGLSNSIARLENLYEQKNLLYFENTGDGTLVRMKVPMVDHPSIAMKE